MPMDEEFEPESPVRKLVQNFNQNCSLEILDSKWKHMAEIELKETPENRRRGLIMLQQFVLNDQNITVPNEDAFLLRFLRARKFDPQKAFRMMQSYYMMKLKCPELFRCSLPSEVSKVLDFQAQYMLPNRDQFGRKVYIIRVDKFDSSKVTIDDIFRTNILALEHTVQEPETQIAGLVVILDMAGLSLHHARFFTPYYAKKTVDVVQETFPLRFKGFHVVNEPFYFDAVMAVLKPFIKEKIRKRIFLHGNNMSSLHAFVCPEILPSEYGGGAGPFDNRGWHLQLLSEENYFKAMENYGYGTQTDDYDNNED